MISYTTEIEGKVSGVEVFDPCLLINLYGPQFSVRLFVKGQQTQQHFCEGIDEVKELVQRIHAELWDASNRD